jgi:lysophospholipase L1-like esterase
MVRLLTGLSVAVAFLGILECSLRGIVTARDDFRLSKPQWYRFSPELGWELQPYYKGNSSVVDSFYREFDAQGLFVEDTSQVLNDEVPRVITLGDSLTFGLGAPPKSSYPEVLEQLLTDLNVINLGVSGFTSFQGYKRLLKDGPMLKPAIIIAGFNYNDRRYVLSPDDVDSDEKFKRDSRLRTVQVLREKLYLYRVLRTAMVKIGIMKAGHVVNESSIEDVRTLQARVSPSDYRANLVKIAQYGRERNVPVIFLLLGDNPLYTQHLKKGVNLLEQRQYESAIRELTIAVNLRNEFSDLARKYLALAHAKTGTLRELDAIVRIDHPFFSLHGGRPIYLDTEYHSIMRAVAKDYSIRVVDAVSVIDRDPSSYVDEVHLDKRGNEKIAALLDKAIKEVLGAVRSDARQRNEVLETTWTAMSNS